LRLLPPAHTTTITFRDWTSYTEVLAEHVVIRSEKILV
jgi:hypothetical protein